MKQIIIFIVKIYQLTLSPILRVLFGRGCRFEITCSEYATDVIGKHGVFKGGSLALRRLSECHS